jgi:polyisoprenoid-binding protein YceI
MTALIHGLQGTFDSDPVHSTFSFSVRHMGVSTFTAYFGDVAAQLTAAEGRLRLDGVAQARSISITTPPAFRERVVNGEDFLDAKSHPEIIFRSDDVRLSSDGAATIHGQLTLRGTTRPIVAAGTLVAPVEDGVGSVRAGLDVTAKIDRRDWGMDFQAPMPDGTAALANGVLLRAQVEFIRAR